MQETIVRFSALHSAISNAPRPAGMTTEIIAIDGCGGSGKSTFAARLGKLLGCPVVHTDDFASWNNVLDWYPRMTEQVMEPLRRNGVARYQRYDWGTRKLAEWLEVEPQLYVIVEGVSSSRAEFREFLTYRIYMEADRETRLKRGLERDGVEALELWRGWMTEEDAYLERDDPMRHADIVVAGSPEMQAKSDSFVSYERK